MASNSIPPRGSNQSWINWVVNGDHSDWENAKFPWLRSLNGTNADASIPRGSQQRAVYDYVMNGNPLWIRSLNGMNADASSGSINGVPHNNTATNAQREVISGSYNGLASINIDVKPLLRLIQDIVEGKPRAQESSKVDFQELQQRTVNPDLGQLIHKITCEILCECQEKGTADQRAKSLLSLLSNYSPDAQIVLALAAFAIRYGDFMVTINQYSTNKSDGFVNSLVLLKQIAGTLESESILKSEIMNIKEVINILLGNVDYILELKGFLSWTSIASEIKISEMTYWMMRAVIYCGFTVSDLCNGHTLSLKERSELAALTQKIGYYYEHLTTHITDYRMREAEAKMAADYQEILGYLRFPPASNIDILFYFISSSKGSNILYNPGTKVSTTLQFFQGKKVLILYTSFATDTFKEELSFLESFYHNTHSKFGYEIVWVPIAYQKTIIDEKTYNLFISKMNWYTLTYEAVLQVNTGMVHLLQKDWGFTGKPMLVVLDERGKVIRQNALLMLHLYGDDAFPFTPLHEGQLLAKISMGMEFLLSQIDIKVSQWIKSKDQYVCLYGGDNIEWCKSMVTLLTTVTKAVHCRKQHHLHPPMGICIGFQYWHRPLKTFASALFFRIGLADANIYCISLADAETSYLHRLSRCNY